MMNYTLDTLKRYFKKTRWSIVLLGVLAFLTHGSILFYQGFGVDTDAIMNGIDNFEELGRPGLVWLGKFFGLDWFNLYYAQALAFLFIIFVPVAFGALFYIAGGAEETRINVMLLALGASVIVSPFWAEQIYFINQSAQVLFACILTALSLLATEFARKKRGGCRWWCLSLAVVLMNLIFSSYQVLVVIYAVGIAMMFLLDGLKNERSVRQQFQWIFFHAGSFLAGFLSYLILFRLFFSKGTSYLGSQIVWGDVGFRAGVIQCIKEILRTLQDDPPYYSGSYGMIALVFLGVTVYRLTLSGKLRRSSNILIVLAEIFLITSPYFFILFYGGQIRYRMQLVMPLSQGCMMYLIVSMLPSFWSQKKVIWKGTIAAAWLAVLLMLGRDISFYMNYCNRLYYTEQWRFEYDIQIAEKLYYDIQEIKAGYELDDSFDNYLFLGIPEIPYNGTALKGEAIGSSNFSHEVASVNRNRIKFLMNVLGYSLPSYFSEGETAVIDAYFEESFGQKVDEMPSYPSVGYMQYLTNDELGISYVVIKLGEPWRPGILLEE